jgi:hypothetical protein
MRVREGCTERYARLFGADYRRFFRVNAYEKSAEINWKVSVNPRQKIPCQLALSQFDKQRFINSNTKDKRPINLGV